MLYEGLGFDIFDDSFKLKTLDSYEGKSIQWTLGALLKSAIHTSSDRFKFQRMPNMRIANGRIVGVGLPNDDYDDSNENLSKRGFGVNGLNQFDLSSLIFYAF